VAGLAVLLADGADMAGEEDAWVLRMVVREPLVALVDGVVAKDLGKLGLTVMPVTKSL
jgi:hypothetical protein